jgi:hypothetical protein
MIPVGALVALAGVAAVVIAIMVIGRIGHRDGRDRHGEGREEHGEAVELHRFSLLGIDESILHASTLASVGVKVLCTS